jgi:hypothetical protein
MPKTCRRQTLWLFFFLFALGCVPLSGLAMDARGEYTILGVGNESCGKFVRARQQSIGAYPDHRYLYWVTGYLPAVNAQTPKTNNIAGFTDIYGVLTWLEHYCTKTPLTPLAEAVRALVTALYPERTTQALE